MQKFFKLNFLFLFSINLFFLFTNNLFCMGWPEEALSKMSLDEKIGQLFISATIIDPYVNSSEKSVLENKSIKEILENIDQTPIEKLITDYHIGGVLYLGNKTTNPEREYFYTKELKKLSKIPLFISQDLEWGLDMRLKGAIKFPFNLTLGAIQDNKLIYDLGKEIGRQCQLIGVNFNFAPVCDVNTNPENPIINRRSFGQDEKNVTKKAIALMQGMQDAGILACAKHFPGHGDTKLDSHNDLPIINHKLDRLEKIELYPFKKIIDAGIKSVMVAHLQVPAIDNKENTPATISHKIITELLKNKLGFKNLIVTDALNMKGALKHHKSGELELKSLLAGADILLCPKDTPKAILSIKEAIKNNLISEETINEKVLKILKAKSWLEQNKPEQNNLEKNKIEQNFTVNLSLEKNLNNQDFTVKSSPEKNLSLDKNLSNFEKNLNNEYAKKLAYKLFSSAITLVKNTDNILPLIQEDAQINTKQNIQKQILEKDTQEDKIACVQISEKKNNLEFFETLKTKINFDKFYLSNKAKQEKIKKITSKLKIYKTVIIGLYNMHHNAKENFGIQESTLKFIKNLAENNKKIILTIFGSPYSLKLFNYLFDNPGENSVKNAGKYSSENPGAIICAYEDTDEAQIASVKVIFGEQEAIGKLPV